MGGQGGSYTEALPDVTYEVDVEEVRNGVHRVNGINVLYWSRPHSSWGLPHVGECVPNRLNG